MDQYFFEKNKIDSTKYFEKLGLKKEQVEFMEQTGMDPKFKTNFDYQRDPFAFL